jgi:hypothetical protein
MDYHVRRRGPFCGEVSPAKRAQDTRSYFSYIVRADDTGEVVLDGYAGDLQEAVQSLDLCLDFLVSRATAAA